MNRNFRLSREKDIKHVKEKGKSKKDQLVLLRYLPNKLEISRAAFVASKFVGNAVTRNLIKRRMRASVAELWSSIKPGLNLVFYARSGSENASYNDLHNSISTLLVQADLVNKKSFNAN